MGHENGIVNHCVILQEGSFHACVEKFRSFLASKSRCFFRWHFVAQSFLYTLSVIFFSNSVWVMLHAETLCAVLWVIPPFLWSVNSCRHARIIIVWRLEVMKSGCRFCLVLFAAGDLRRDWKIWERKLKVKACCRLKIDFAGPWYGRIGGSVGLVKDVEVEEEEGFLEGGFESFSPILQKANEGSTVGSNREKNPPQGIELSLFLWWMLFILLHCFSLSIYFPFC